MKAGQTYDECLKELEARLVRLHRAVRGLQFGLVCTSLAVIVLGVLR